MTQTMEVISFLFGLKTVIIVLVHGLVRNGIGELGINAPAGDHAMGIIDVMILFPDIAIIISNITNCRQMVIVFGYTGFNFCPILYNADIR